MLRCCQQAPLVALAALGAISLSLRPPPRTARRIPVRIQQQCERLEEDLPDNDTTRQLGLPTVKQYCIPRIHQDQHQTLMCCARAGARQGDTAAWYCRQAAAGGSSERRRRWHLRSEAAGAHSPFSDQHLYWLLGCLDLLLNSFLIGNLCPPPNTAVSGAWLLKMNVARVHAGARTLR